MRVPGLPPQLVQALVAALPARPASSFAPAIESERAANPPVAMPAASPATSVQLLVALAAAEPAIERRRRIAIEAERGLRGLERLHDALLAGPLPPERIEEIAAWVEAAEAPADRELEPVFREIALRVRVELAKHEMRA